MKPPLTPLTAPTAPASTAAVAPLGSAAAAAALPLLFDTHCHCVAPDEASRVRSLCVVSTSEDDWLATEASGTARCSRHVDCRVAYGVHPWWAAAVRPGWEQRLRARLLASPSALVGECGLDGQPPREGRPFSPMHEQLLVFTTTLQLAAELSRPVSLHWVQAPQMLETLTAQPSLPPVLLFHAYCGSIETARQLMRLPARVYFGIGARCARSAKALRMVAALPEERLLLESDQHTDDAMAVSILGAAAVVGDSRGWSLARTAEVTTRNARNALDPQGWVENTNSLS